MDDRVIAYIAAEWIEYGGNVEMFLESVSDIAEAIKKRRHFRAASDVIETFKRAGWTPPSEIKNV